MLASAQTSLKVAARPAASRRSERAHALTVRASAREEQAKSFILPRRDILAGAASLAATIALPASAVEYQTIPIDKLIKRERMTEDLPNQSQNKPYKEGMRAEIQALIIKELQAAEGLDFRKCIKLVFNDAASYSKETKTGGINGSVHFPEELKRPENKGLEGTIAILAQVKERVDKASTTEYPVSWADLINYAARIKTKKAFQDIVRVRASAGNADTLLTVGANEFEFPALCAMDATSPDPAGSVPGPNATVAEWKAKFLSMGLNKRDFEFLAAMVIGDSEEEAEAFLRQDPEMAAVLDNQVRQKALLTRSPYEVPFGKALIKLTAVGAVYDPLAYLYPYKKEVLRLT